ncbi:MAG: hypothetical protein C5B49_00550 [Bdellovibrio sp.]|nr:MAG: hypothetical protein C5B49_00550 [Bdellovibrio sp.]
MKAHLRYYTKNKIHNRYVMEVSIYEIERSPNYPDGIKYGLICKDLKTGEYVLLDNHHPKGPHVHINDREFPYEYVNDDRLIVDFETLVLKELGVKL